jgi:uracil-DNA glycosylase family 4
MTDARHERARVVLSRLEMLEEMGLGPAWLLRGRRPAPSVGGAAGEAPPAAGEAVASPVEVVASPVASRPAARTESAAAAELPAEASWSALATEVAGCRRCGLCAGRRQAVLGVGDRRADWLFVGEGPGAEEDLRGEPFVGPAGQLLDAMLAAIALKRGENVYIANAVKCRPPGNRTPAPEEIAACRPYLERQIALLQPKLIVLLGKAAAQAVLGSDEPLARLRGRDFGYRGIPVLVTYHPAYYLRSPLEKAKGWEDLCRARQLIGASPEKSHKPFRQ